MTDAEEFVEELQDLFRRHGVYIDGRGHGHQFAIVKLQEPHERPIDYPEIDVLHEKVSFSTLCESYGAIDWGDD